MCAELFFLFCYVLLVALVVSARCNDGARVRMIVEVAHLIYTPVWCVFNTLMSQLVVGQVGIVALESLVSLVVIQGVVGLVALESLSIHLAYWIHPMTLLIASMI